MEGNRFLWFALLGASLLTAYPALAQDVRLQKEGKEQAIDVSKVPMAALDQAKKTLDGEITDVYLVEVEGQQVYEFEGTNAAGEEKAIYVSSDGNILKSEMEGEGEKEGTEE